MSGGGWWTILHHRELDSTQSEARRQLAREGRIDRWAISAEVQRAGVGRFRRAFDSRAGGAWQTLVLAGPSGSGQEGRPTPTSTPKLAAALAEALAERNRDVRLKWPNDLFLGGRKCGGILIERVQGHLLIGVGINAENEPPPGFARIDLPPGEVREMVRDVVREVVGEVVGETSRGGDAKRPARSPAGPGQAWLRRDLLRGRTVTVGGRRGVANGIAPDGALCLLLPTGEVVQVRSGTVDRIDPPIESPIEPPIERGR